MKHRRTQSACLAGVLLAGVAALASAQYAKPSDSPVAVVTGVMGYQSTFTPGVQSVNPEFAPILLVPLGRKLLIESEFEARLDYSREDAKWGPAVVDYGIEYLQLDYLAHPNLTVTAGRFLTPFGIYRERLHPIWIRNLATEPIIFALNESSSNGAMLRGAARVSSAMNITYETYYSAASQRKLFEAERQAGGRASLVFPDQRLEVGASFNRNLGNERTNMTGLDLTWIPKSIPLDIRAEGLRNPLHGRGYWVEVASRLNKLGSGALLRNSQVVARGEQFWVPKAGEDAMADEGEAGEHELPDVNTARLTVGWNFYLYDGFRFTVLYGHNFAEGHRYGIWSVGANYRFAIF